MRALLSVYDKAGLIELAAKLRQAGLELISTGNTMRVLAESGIDVRAVSDITGSPEMLEGRVKTLHPAIHGGLLARRDLPEHMAEIERYGIEPIDLVVSNLYPFAEVTRQATVSLEDVLENIDIGGPTLIRAAAKNFPSVLILVDPSDYDAIGDQLVASGLDGVPEASRRMLAAKAFAHVASYDSVIAQYLRPEDELPEQLSISGKRVRALRYGENPHQAAALYELQAPGQHSSAASWNVRHGKEMSFNNYLDANAAWSAAYDFADPTVVIVKHTGPCGIASDDNLSHAYELALASDPVSAFGGVVALNRPVDQETAELVAKHHFDIVMAPSFVDAAYARLRRKRNLRLIEIDTPASAVKPALPFDIRMLDGAFLAQTPDRAVPDNASWRVVTSQQPTAEQLESMAFAWQSVRYVKSNAILLAQGHATVGIGGGQPNRVDSVRIAAERAGERAKGSVLASDALFPFPDNIEVAAEAGVAAIVQPGGSVKDEEVIAAAEAAGIAMVFTGIRHFRH